jgi:hypothetical protein
MKISILFKTISGTDASTLPIRKISYMNISQNKPIEPNGSQNPRQSGFSA